MATLTQPQPLTVITALDVSYGTALLPAPFRRYTLKDGQGVNLNPGGTTAVYLWLRSAGLEEDSNASPPLTDVAVLYDDEPTPDGWRKVLKSLSPGAAERSYLIFKCADPTADVNVLVVAALHVTAAPGSGGEPSVASAVCRVVERPLIRSGPPLRLVLELCSQQRRAEPSAASWGESLKPGDWVDCCDKGRRWRVARVLEADTDALNVGIAYKGWSAKHNELVPRSSARLSRPGSHTAGRDTRSIRRQGEAFSVDLEVLESLQLRIDEVMSGEFPPEERDAFCRGELPAYLEEVLSSKYESEPLRDRINVFNQKVLELCVWHIKRLEEPLPPEVRQHLARLFLDDHHCNYFFMQYGGTVPAAGSTHECDGPAARLPLGGASRYYVANVNFFYQAGGHDAILARLRRDNAAARAALSRAGQLLGPLSFVSAEGDGGGLGLELGGDETGAVRNSSGGSTTGAAAAAIPATPALLQGGGDNSGAVPASAASSAASASADSSPYASSSSSSSAVPDAVADAAAYCAVLMIPKACYTEAWALGYTQPCRDALLESMLLLTDAQLKRVGREAVESIGERLEALAKGLTCTSYPLSAAAIIAGPAASERGLFSDGISYVAAFERWRMSMAARFIRCESLALRVKGISDIKDMAEKVAEAASAPAFGSPFTSTPTLTYGGRQWSQGAVGKGVQVFSRPSVGPLALPPSSLAPHANEPLSFPIAAPPLMTSPTAHWYDVPKFLSFLHQARVVEVMLGSRGSAGAPNPGVHVQTLTRTGPVLVFLASAAGTVPSLDAPGLTASHIELLFGLLASDDDDGLRRAVLEIVRSLARHLPVPLLDVVHRHLDAIPLPRYDEATVLTLKEFTAQGLLTVQQERLAVPQHPVTITREDMERLDGEEEEAGGGGGDPTGTAPPPPSRQQQQAQDEQSFLRDPHNWWGLLNLWQAANDDVYPRGDASAPGPPPSSASPDAALAARDALVELTRSRPAHAAVFIRLCAENVASGSSVFPSLLLLERLLQLRSPAPERAGAARRAGPLPPAWAASEALSDLPSSLIADLQRFKHDTLHALIALQGGDRPDACEASAVVLGRHSYHENVALRLRFLLRFMLAAGRRLNFEDVEMLWRIVVEGALCEEEREEAFLLLHSGCFNGEGGAGEVAGADTGGSVEAPLSRELGPGARVIPLSVALDMARRLFCNPLRFSVGDLGPVAYRAFESYFCLLNGSTPGRLLRWSGHDLAVGPAGIACSPMGGWDLQLEGLERLWECVLSTQRSAVYKAAAAFLVALYVHLDIDEREEGERGSEQEAEAAPGARGDSGAVDIPSPYTRPKGVWTAFVRRCMDAIAAPSSAAAAAASAASKVSSGGGSAACAPHQVTTLRAARLLSVMFSSLEDSRPLIARTGPAAFDERAAPPPTRFLAVSKDGSAPQGAAAAGGEGAGVPSWLCALEGPDITFPSARGPATMLVWLYAGSSSDQGSQGGADAPPPRPQVPYRLLLQVRPLHETFGQIRDRVTDAAKHLGLRGSIRPEDLDGRGPVRFFLLHRPTGPEPPATAVDPRGLSLLPPNLEAPVWRPVPWATAEHLPLGNTMRSNIREFALQLDASAPGAGEPPDPHVYRSYQQRLLNQYRILVPDAAAVPDTDLAPYYAAFIRARLDEWDAIQAPRRAISDNPAHFNQLFALLSSPHPVLVAQAWGLLQALPTNAQVERDIRTLRGRFLADTADAAPSAGGPSGAREVAGGGGDNGARGGAVPSQQPPLNWAEIFDGGAPLRLLYSLKILVRHLRSIEPAAPAPEHRAAAAAAEPAAAPNSPHSPAAADDGDNDTPSSGLLQASDTPRLDVHAPWCRTFIDLGGARHLVSLLMGLDLGGLLGPGAPDLFQEAVRQLVAVVTALLLGGGGQHDGDEGYLASSLPRYGTAPAPLVVRLLEVLSQVTARDLPQRSTEGGEGKGGGESPLPPAATPQQPSLDELQGEDDASLSSSEEESEGGSEGEGDAEVKGRRSGARAAPSASFTAAADATGDAPLPCIVRCVTALLPALLLPHAPAPAPTALDTFTAFEGIAPLLSLSLLAPNDCEVRRAVGQGLLSVCVLEEMRGTGIGGRFTQWLLCLLLRSLPTVLAFPESCGEFFGCLQRLLGPLPTTATPARPLPTAARPLLCRDPWCCGPRGNGGERCVLATLAAMLRAHPIVEVGSEEGDVKDAVLAQLLLLLGRLLEGRQHLKEWAAAPPGEAVALPPSDGSPEGPGPLLLPQGLDLAHEVFDSCLFALPTAPEPSAAEPRPLGAAAGAVASVLGGRLPKCKSEGCRKAAFSLLLTLAGGSVPNCTRISRLVLPHHDAEAAAAEVAAATAKAASRGLPPAPCSPVLMGKPRLSVAADADDDEPTGPALRPGRYGGISSSSAPPAAPPSPARAGGRGRTPGALGLSPSSAAAASGPAMSGRSRNLTQPRSSSGYVGLRNLGCICYMNSTVQQFFMTPALRRAVLSWVEPAPPGSGERSDSIMFQLQRMFAYLQESEKQAYNPRGLCGAIKDWEGAPTDVTEQKDVPEFLTKLFSDIETQCQGTPLSTLIKDVYGGVQLQELIAEDPKGGRLYTAREEEFSFIQVHIKNHRTLAEALQEYVAGESVDYKWDLPPPAGASAAPAGGAAPVPTLEQVTLKTTRRVSLRSIGDHLMLHLNRFEFDYDSMQQVKLNDRFEFPRELDVWPYTVCGRSDAIVAAAPPGAGAPTVPAPGGGAERSAFTFELVGVVIHMGTAVGGHYYSYVRERGAEGPQPGDRWLEFNDQYVCPWDGGGESFDKDCFGGTEVVASSSALSRSSTFVHERARTANAFILFYARMRSGPPAGPEPPSSPPPEAQPITVAALLPVVRVCGGAAGGGRLVFSPPSDPLATFRAVVHALHGDASDAVRASARAPVPADVLAEIREDNLEFWRLRTIYQLDYFAFLQALVRETAAMVVPAGGGAPSLPPPPVPLPVLRLAVSFLLNTLTDSNQKPRIPEWMETARALLRASPPGSGWLLRTAVTDPTEFRRQMLGDSGGNSDMTRNLLVRLCATALEVRWPLELAACPPLAAALGLLPAPQPQAQLPRGDAPVVAPFIGLLLDQIPRLHLHARRIGPLFKLLLAFAELGGAALLVRAGTLGRLIDLLLNGNGSPHPELCGAAARPSHDMWRALGEGAGGGEQPPTLALAPSSSPPAAPTRPALDSFTALESEALLSLIGVLLLACLPPSNAPGSPSAPGAVLPLSSTDADMVTCPAFLAALCEHLGSEEAARRLAPLFVHILWGAAVPEPGTAPEAPPPGDDAPADDPSAPAHPEPLGPGAVVANLAFVIAEGVVESDYDDLKPWFRAAALAVGVAGDSEGDALQRARVACVLETLVAAMHKCARFYRATEAGIELFTKLAKRRPLVAQWAAEHAPDCVWMLEWLSGTARLASTANASSASATTYSSTTSFYGRSDYQQQPALPNGMKMFKRSGYSSYSSYGSGAARNEFLLQNVGALLDPPREVLETGSWGSVTDALFFDAYESDDEPEHAFGRTVSVWRQHGNPRNSIGVVESYDAAPGVNAHIVRFESGERQLVDFADTRKFGVYFLPPAAQAPPVEQVMRPVQQQQPAPAPAKLPPLSTHATVAAAGVARVLTSSPQARQQSPKAALEGPAAPQQHAVRPLPALPPRVDGPLIMIQGSSLPPGPGGGDAERGPPPLGDLDALLEDDLDDAAVLGSIEGDDFEVTHLLDDSSGDEDSDSGSTGARAGGARAGAVPLPPGPPALASGRPLVQPRQPPQPRSEFEND